MGPGNTLDDASIRKLREVYAMVRSQTITPPAPLRRRRNNSGGASADVVVVFGSNVGPGVYNGTMYTGMATAATLTGSAPTGMIAGSACLIMNGPEMGWSGTAWEPPGPWNGTRRGKDAATGLPIVLVGAFRPAACNTSSGTTSEYDG